MSSQCGVATQSAKWPPGKPVPGQSGFTLLEVLIALAVLALAMLAGIRAIGQQAVAAEILTEQTLAGWVASNAVTELKLRQPWPQVGRSTGQALMGQKNWYWQIEVSATDVEQMRRIEVRVFTDAGRQQGVSNLIAFAGRR